MKGLVASLIFLCAVACSKPEKSRFVTIEQFPSAFIKAKTVTIFLPESYYSSDDRYLVLYMHDGRMLFDSTTTWNGQEWGVDEKIDALIQAGEIREVIVVASTNGGNELRHPEYFPQKPFESLPGTVKDSLYNLYRDQGTPLFANPVQSDEYLKFMVQELKPFIDEGYRTESERENTFIAGSSMGGLISMYAISEYPEVYGGAACLSTHWPGIFTTENNPIPAAFFSYLEESLPDPESHRLYFDFGTETLDALYEPYQLVVDSIVRSKGYGEANFLRLKFEGHKHDARDWNKRSHIPLTFFLVN